jgi:hypothetical protein
LGGWGSKGAIFFHGASVSNAPGRAIGPPSALLTFLMPHLRKSNHLHFSRLYWVVQQLLDISPFNCIRKSQDGASGWQKVKRRSVHKTDQEPSIKVKKV